MKHSFKKTLNFICIGGFTLANLCSCSLFGSKDDTPFDQKLVSYLKKDLPVVNVSSEKYAAYFDFSGAMTACNDIQTGTVFNGLCQKITGNAENFDIFKMGNSEISPIDGDVRPAQVFAQLKNANSRQEFYAPIENTLKKITDEGRSALLVTDFEEYTKQGQIYTHAYATPYFKKWLASGGDITFFVTDYMEGNLAKHLYYVVFDYNQHGLLRLVEDGLQGLPENYERFTLATNSYPLTPSYLSASKGGTFHDASGDDIISQSVEDGSPDGFFMVDSLRAESYVFGSNWEDIVENASYQTVSNGIDKDEVFTHLFRNVYVDLTHSDSYKINSLAVRVTDIQEDFDKFWGYYQAINNKPKIAKEAGETYLDFEGHEEGEQYYDENGNLLQEWDYSKSKGNIFDIQDMLDFDNDLFLESYKQDPAHAELGIYFHKGFNGTILQQKDASDLLRIDIVVAKAEICPLTQIERLFYWPGNDCLSASIKSVLQDMKPIGKPIYSYFVRIL